MGYRQVTESPDDEKCHRPEIHRRHTTHRKRPPSCDVTARAATSGRRNDFRWLISTRHDGERSRDQRAATLRVHKEQEKEEGDINPREIPWLSAHIVVSELDWMYDRATQAQLIHTHTHASHTVATAVVTYSSRCSSPDEFFKSRNGTIFVAVATGLNTNRCSRTTLSLSQEILDVMPEITNRSQFR